MTNRSRFLGIVLAFAANAGLSTIACAQGAGTPAPASPQAPAPKRDRAAKVLDPDLLMHLGVTAGRIRGGTAVDETGKVRGRIVGNPMQTTLGPSEGFRFNGETDWVVLADQISGDRIGLPTRDVSISTWVSVPAKGLTGTIIGCVQEQAGWSIGFERDAFTFTLAGSGGKAPTTLRGTRSITPGKWYNVVGTYDGRSMKLFVNGEMEAESKDQSGDIAYAPTAAYAIAATRAGGPGGRFAPSAMTMLEARVLGRAISPQQVTEEFIPGTQLTSFEPKLEQTQRFVVRPILQFATQTTMTIVWETSRPGKGVVEYGETLPYTMRAGSEEEKQIHRVTLTGLKPQTPYFYRVRTIEPDGSETLGEDLTFQTAVLEDTPFAFAIIGDTQKNKPVIEKLQTFSYTLRPNFQIHLGDVVDKGADKSEWTDELLAASYPLMSRVCMYPSIGNHEDNHSHYYNYFVLPAPQCWYTFTYGNAQFFSLDTNKPIDPESEQYKWLDAELGKSKATWKFVYHHHPVYSSDEDDYGNTYKTKSTLGDVRLRPLAPLLEKHRVDIDFNGHIHCYERSWPIFQDKIDQDRGVRYITSGGGGGGLESAAPSRTWFAQRVYRGHHVSYAMVHGKTLQFQVFDLEGRLIDTFEYRKP